MSYRSLKRLLGETSLERKCRFLLGSSLIILISGSFYWYAHRNLAVFEAQFRQRAQLLISQNLQTTHWKNYAVQQDPESKDIINDLANSLKPSDLREDSWKFIGAHWEDAPTEERPSEEAEHEALRRLEKGEPYHVHEDNELDTYQYFEPVRVSKNCLACHQQLLIDQKRPHKLVAGEMMGIAKLSIPLSATRNEIAKNNALLITLALVTGFLAMTVSYLIVRYIIVKPVLHLKDVSDAVAHGDLDKRADIRTGDEFEELSHAYNRMLRHLVTTQDELRTVNSSLDNKVGELAQANLSLHEMNKLKNDFLATMSHELRTPLNSILGFSDLLSTSDAISDRHKKYITNIQVSGKHLLMLINDILDLAKIEAGKMELHPVEFPVADLIERITAAMAALAERKNIEMVTAIDPELPLARQDSGKLQQVLYNLLSNAVKFTPEGGRIKVVAQRYGLRDVDFIVADTGIGIPLEDQAVIFEKFRQGRSLPGQDGNAMTREFEGTGLGLSIVKELCRLMKGEVFLESEFGKGSTFTVRVPLRLDLVNTSVESDSSTLPLELRKSRMASLGLTERPERPAEF
ncbi:MAG: HAMP domain-containing protein [Planctomycetota bacterium]|nr:MAG: HAMP domain-containing protein [Planctomycetota bacterium]